jgi:hypothetical protein
MKLASEVFVVGDREKERVQGRKKREKKGGKMGGKKRIKKVRWKEWKTYVAIRCTMNLKCKRRYKVTMRVVISQLLSVLVTECT